MITIKAEGLVMRHFLLIGMLFGIAFNASADGVSNTDEITMDVIQNSNPGQEIP